MVKKEYELHIGNTISFKSGGVMTVNEDTYRVPPCTFKVIKLQKDKPRIEIKKEG